MIDTIFDKILRKEIPSTVVYEDEDVLAFNDVNPIAPVHVLVVPKIKIERFQDLVNQDPLITGKFFQKVALVAEKLGLKDNGYRIIINNGSHGGQEVEYIHAHILGGKKLSFPKP